MFRSWHIGKIIYSFNSYLTLCPSPFSFLSWMNLLHFPLISASATLYTLPSLSVSSLFTPPPSPHTHVFFHNFLNLLSLWSVLLAAILSTNVCRLYKTFMTGYKTCLSWRLSRVEGSWNMICAAHEMSGLNQGHCVGSGRSKLLQLVILWKVFKASFDNCGILLWVVTQSTPWCFY